MMTMIAADSMIAWKISMIVADSILAGAVDGRRQFLLVGK